MTDYEERTVRALETIASALLKLVEAEVDPGAGVPVQVVAVEPPVEEKPS